MLFFTLVTLVLVAAATARHIGDAPSNNPLETKGLFEGDMVLPRASNNLRFHTKSKAKLWPKGVVHYQLHKNMEKHRYVIQRAMKEFEAETCVKFVEKKSSSIFSAGRDYIEIINGDGCWSFIGNQKSGKQQLSLGTGCLYKGTILHELMHALGFGHMHNNHNRDEYIKINWHNIDEEQKHNFELQDSRWFEMAVFDYSSIMLYGSTAFSKNYRSPTMIHKLGGKLREPYEKHNFSNNDLYYINKLYNCPRDDLSLKDTQDTFIS